MPQPRSLYHLILTQFTRILFSLGVSKKGFESTTILLLSNVFVTLLGLVRTPLITWMFPKNEVGMVGVVTSWLPFIQLISMSGIDTAAYHYVTKGHGEAFSAGVYRRLIWSIFGCLGFGAGAVFWFYRNTPDTGVDFHHCCNQLSFHLCNECITRLSWSPRKNFGVVLV